MVDLVKREGVLGQAWLILANYARPSDWAALMKFRGWACGVGSTRRCGVMLSDGQVALIGWLAGVQFG